MNLVQEPAVGRIRACDNCNRKKKRCNGGQPQCHLCMHTGTICSYSRFSLKPGPKKGLKRASLSNRKRGEARQPTETPRSANGDQDWSVIRDGRDSMLDTAPLYPTTSHRSSISQELNEYHARDHCSKSSESSLNTVLDRTRRQSGSHVPSHHHSGADPVLPPRELLSHLVEVYFDFVHPQLRLLHRPSLLPWVRSGEFTSCPNSTLLLSAMCALAAMYSDQCEVDIFERSLSNDSEGNNSQLYKAKKRWERGKSFLSQANKLLRSEISKMEKLELDSGRLQKPSIMLVQAAALLSFAEVGLGASSRAYSLISTTVRLAYDYGLDSIDDYNTISDKHAAYGVDADDSRSELVKKEELRRAWWAISDLENFICTAKSRPRMIDWEQCKTKLPCDDKDWFEGRECPLFFLPAGLPELSASPDLPSYISIMAYRILAMHLMAKLMSLAVRDDYASGTHGTLSTIEDCVAIWKQNIPREVILESPFQRTSPEVEVLSDAFPLRILLDSALLLSSKIRMFKGATPSKVFRYCQDILNEGSNSDQSPENSIPRPLESQAFSDALRASDAVCSIVRDWSSHSIARSCPFIVGALWTPACIQLLVKSFAGASFGLAEKASLSLRILTMAMEQFAEFWGLGQYLFNSFRKYERKLSDLDGPDNEQGDWDQHIAARAITFPDYIDAPFLRGLSLADSPDVTTALFAGAEWERYLDSVVASDSTTSLITDGVESYGFGLENLGWMDVDSGA